MLNRRHHVCILVSPIAEDLEALKMEIGEEADWIGVDAGYQQILKQGYELFAAIGDFDSDHGKLPTQCEVIELPVKKDETDSQAAMQLACSLGYQRIILTGALGGRLDHAIANLKLMIWHYPQVELIDQKQRAMVLLPGEHTFKKKEAPDHISFFACEHSCISLEGFLYPLKHQQLNQSDIFTCSNSLEASQAKIIVEYGRILCVESSYR